MKNNANRRKREKQEFRLRVLDAARELFAAAGAEGVTLRRVAEKIEYSATSIYQHFPNKSSLIEELCTADFAVHERVFQQAARVPDPIESLKKTFTAYIDFGFLNPWHYRVMFMIPNDQGANPPRDDSFGSGNSKLHSSDPLRPEHANQDTGRVSVTTAVYNFLHAAVFRAMAAGKLRIEFRDAHEVTQSMWCGLHGVVSLQLLRSSHQPVNWRPAAHVSGTTIECLLRGIVRREIRD